MIKSSVRPVLTIQWKIFLSNQINFLIGQECFLQKLKIGHISPHIDHVDKIYMFRRVMSKRFDVIFIIITINIS